MLPCFKKIVRKKKSHPCLFILLSSDIGPQPLPSSGSAGDIGGSSSGGGGASGDHHHDDDDDDDEHMRADLEMHAVAVASTPTGARIGGFVGDSGISGLAVSHGDVAASANCKAAVARALDP